MCYKNKYVFFPYSKEILPVIHYYLSQGVPAEMINVFGYDGDFMIGKDIGFLEGETELGIVVEGNSMERISSEQMLYISSHKNQKAEIVEKLIVKSLKFGNVVYCRQRLEEEFLKKISDKGLNFQNTFTYRPVKDDWSQSIAEEKIFTFPVPVVYVSELVPGYLEGSKILLYLKGRLEKEGYKVLVIGKGTLLEDISLEQFFSKMNVGDNFTKRILYLNHFIWNEIQKEKYDIVFVETIDTLLRYNSQIVGNGFGIYTHILSCAIPPKYCVNCLSCEIISEEKSKISKKIENLLSGCEVFCVSTSHMIYEENIFEPIQICMKDFPQNDASTIAKNLHGMGSEIDKVFDKLISDLQNLE